MQRGEIQTHFVGSIQLLVRGDTRNLEPQLRKALADIDPNLTIITVQSMNEQVASNFDQQRMVAQLAGTFGVIAVLLAAIGLYGLTAYTVALPNRRDRSAHGSRSRPAEHCATGPAGSISASGDRVTDWNSSGHRRGTPHGRAAIRDTQLGSACVRVFNSCARGLRRGRQYSPGTSSRFDGSTEGAAH